MKSHINFDYSIKGYTVKEKIVSEETANALCALSLRLISNGTTIRGANDAIETKHSFNNSNELFWIPFIMLTPIVEEVIGTTIYPSYFYQRVYTYGATLPEHVDREQCEISASIHLGSDSPWSIIANDNTINLTKGDALIYKGTEVIHSRPNTYTGDYYSQLFLHWVTDQNNIDKNNPTPQEALRVYEKQFRDYYETDQRRQRTGTVHQRGD
jgi:hypothetical protein